MTDVLQVILFAAGIVAISSIVCETLIDLFKRIYVDKYLQNLDKRLERIESKERDDKL